MVKFFWMPLEVWYYVVIPIVVILLIYFFFNIFYRKKKDSYYYNYVVDYVYSTLGIIFCSLLLCLLLGYSIATIQIIIQTGLLENYLFLTIILIILPIVPFGFLIYVIKIYLHNAKQKAKLDSEYALINSASTKESANEAVFSEPEPELKKIK